MIVFEAAVRRRIVARLSRGERIPQALLDLARDQRIRCGWLSALGAFEWVELCEYDQEKKAYRPPYRFSTPCEILSLTGNLSERDGKPFWHLHAALSRETDNGVQVVGGHLLDGSVFSCEVFIECFEEPLLRREHDPDTGLSLWVGTEAVEPVSAGRDSAPRAKTGGAAVSWAHVAAASAPSPAPLPPRKRVDRSDQPILEIGDWVDHKQFGVCRVDGEDGEGATLIRMANGARKAIRLDFMDILPPRFDGERRTYPLSPRKR